jgi:membrane protease YdiL (CAAX protease family)
MSERSIPLPMPARYHVFTGPNGIRAGWRLLIFAAIFAPLFYLAGRSVEHFHTEAGTVLSVTLEMGVFLIALLLATWIMTLIEGRSFADYGLPWRRAFCRQYWQGAAISFTSLAGLMLVMNLLGGLSFGGLALHGIDILKYGIAWIVPLFAAALLEDFFYRGYLLFTLTTGIGFWPAAIVTSLWMGGMHSLNPGGHGLGPVAATLYCLVTCLVLRRTGDLWMALGIHSAWNWGEIFFFSVPSSGFPGQQHLFKVSLHGPTWLTGGGFGPEASVPNFVLLLSWGFLFALWLRGVKYPRPGAVDKHRR